MTLSAVCGLVSSCPHFTCSAWRGGLCSLWVQGWRRAGGGKQSIQSLLELSGGPACGQLPLGAPHSLVTRGSHTHGALLYWVQGPLCVAMWVPFTPELLRAAAPSPGPERQARIHFFFKDFFFLCGPFFKVLFNLLQYCFCYRIWFLSQEAPVILAHRPGIEPTPPCIRR